MPASDVSTRAASPQLRPPVERFGRRLERCGHPTPARARGRSPRRCSTRSTSAINRLIARTLPGSRRAAGVGLGTELAQLRPYEPGDDVRHIDAAASARTAALHVRVHVPERALTTWIVLDLSPSMAFGTARRLKADVAEGAALVFARLGLRRAGSVGVVAFGAEEARAGSGSCRRAAPSRAWSRCASCSRRESHLMAGVRATRWRPR